MTVNAIIRRVALVYLIVSSISASVLCFIWGQPMWGTFIASCFALTLIFEIISYVKDKETISTKYKHWRMADGFKSALVLVLLISSFIALGVHLWPK